MVIIRAGSGQTKPKKNCYEMKFCGWKCGRVWNRITGKISDENLITYIVGSLRLLKYYCNFGNELLAILPTKRGSLWLFRSHNIMLV